MTSIEAMYKLEIYSARGWRIDILPQHEGLTFRVNVSRLTRPLQGFTGFTLDKTLERAFSYIDSLEASSPPPLPAFETLFPNIEKKLSSGVYELTLQRKQVRGTGESVWLASILTNEIGPFTTGASSYLALKALNDFLYEEVRA